MAIPGVDVIPSLAGWVSEVVVAFGAGRRSGRGV